MKNKISAKKLTGYLLPPLAFFVIIYLFLYCTCKPFVGIALGSWEMFSNTSGSDDTEIYNDIFTRTSLLGYTGEINASDITYPTYGAIYGEIEIYTNNTVYQVPLVYGDSKALLKRGGGMYIGSHFPGEGSTTLVSGHNNNYFNCLRHTQVGETIEIKTNYGKYKYEITDISVKHMTDSSAYDLDAKKETLVLYTCYPFSLVGFKVDRLFVTATLVSGPQIIPDN